MFEVAPSVVVLSLLSGLTAAPLAPRRDHVQGLLIHPVAAAQRGLPAQEPATERVRFVSDLLRYLFDLTLPRRRRLDPSTPIWLRWR